MDAADRVAGRMLRSISGFNLRRIKVTRYAQGLRVMRGVNLAQGSRVMRGVNLARLNKEHLLLQVYMM